MTRDRKYHYMEYHYMITEHKVVGEDTYVTTNFYDLDYPLDSEQNIRRFIDFANPKRGSRGRPYTHFEILFIYELKGN